MTLRLLLAPLAMTVAALDALLDALLGPTAETIQHAQVADGVGPWTSTMYADVTEIPL